MRTGPEKNFWDWLRIKILGQISVQRHEDKYTFGIPDVSYGVNGVNGWIELKAYNKWPTSGLHHLTIKQVNWLTERGRVGGNCFVLVRVKKSIMIFDWRVSPQLIKKNCNEKVMRSLALYEWYGVFNVGKFIKILTNGDNYGT